MNEKRLGKLGNVRFGYGGYQNSCIGISFNISGAGWGVADNNTAWDANLVKVSDHTKWTEEDRSKQYDEIMRYVSKLLYDAKVDSIDDLNGIPVEAEFNGNLLKDWRVLTEVI